MTGGDLDQLESGPGANGCQDVMPHVVGPGLPWCLDCGLYLDAEGEERASWANSWDWLTDRPWE